MSKLKGESYDVVISVGGQQRVQLYSPPQTKWKMSFYFSIVTTFEQLNEKMINVCFLLVFVSCT